MKAFTSYSHHDHARLERLHAHSAILRRDGSILQWHDRDIPAGGSINHVICAHLESSQLFLPLVSPDFLKSTYCYDKEMRRALERHAAGEMWIVPIILEPCDWQSSPLNQFKALPTDGKPVSEWANENAAFLNVVTELRRLIEGPELRAFWARRKVQSTKRSLPRRPAQFERKRR